MSRQMAEGSLRAHHHKQATGSYESDRERVLRLIRDHRGLTIWQTAILMGVDDNQISGRFSELRALERIRESNVFVPNPETGCDAVIWIAL